MSYPSGLLRLYRSTSGQKSLLGPISWDGTPTITADGVTAGAGPSFGTLTRGAGKVFCAKVKMTIASADVLSDMHIVGPMYIREGLLVAKLDGAEATHAHTWAANDVVNVRIEVTPSGLTVGDF